MKRHRLWRAVTVLVIVTAQALAQPLIGEYVDPDLSPSKQGHRRWRPLTYETSSTYPYASELPPWREIPTLLKWMSLNQQVFGSAIAYEQLKVMSRADFKAPRASHSHAGMVSNYYWSQSIAGWSNWWVTIGASYQQRVEREGRQDMEAWQLVTRGRAVPPPTYRVAIPQEWVFKSTLASGDYGARPFEVLTLKRTSKAAWLIRAVRRDANDRVRWEEWQPLTIQQADAFALSVAYAIDHPWLVIGNEVKQNRRWSKEGRRFVLYYPWFRFHLADLQGNIWWNDPAAWHGLPASIDGWGLGAVCTILWRRFPELTTGQEVASPQAGWREIAMPADDRMLALAIQDLRVPDNVIEHLWWDKRMSLALRTLEQFGRPEHVSAIDRMERELSERLRIASEVLADDPNGSLPKRVASELLASARRARTACESGIRTLPLLDVGPESIQNH